MAKRQKNMSPLWQYQVDDLTTWKYLNVNFKHKGKEQTAWVLNPLFKFKHLDKIADEGVIL